MIIDRVLVFFHDAFKVWLLFFMLKNLMPAYHGFSDYLVFLSVSI